MNNIILGISLVLNMISAPYWIPELAHYVQVFMETVRSVQ